MIGLLLRAKDNADVSVYTVHEPPHPPADRIDRAESLVFVRDGFSWGAALFSPFYFVFKGQWFALAAYLAAATIISAILSLIGAGEQWISVGILALNAFIGFEASSLERAWLSFRGWQDVGTVSGRNRPEAERRFFERWLDTQPVLGALSHHTPPKASGWRQLLGARA